MRQAEALAILQSGTSVFLTGAPGAGKTYVLNEFVHQARAEGAAVSVTASTGIAATRYRNGWQAAIDLCIEIETRLNNKENTDEVPQD